MKKNLFSNPLRGLSLAIILLTIIGTHNYCKKPDVPYEEPMVSIDPAPKDNTFIFEQKAGSNTFTLKSNRKWTITKSAEDWFAITPTTGDAGEHKISITVLENKGEAREGSFTIATTTKKVTYNIQQKSASGKTIDYTPLSVLAEMGKDLDQNGKTIEEDIHIKAIVTTHFEGKQFPFSAYHHIQDAEGNAIVATLSKGTGKAIPFGTQIVANLKGQKIKNYNGTIQIELNGKDITTTPDMAIEPKVVTLQDVLEGKCVNQYIRIKGVQFKNYKDQIYFDGEYSTKRHQVEDKEGRVVTLEIWKNCIWGSEKLPQGSGTLTCVSTINKSKKGKIFYNLRPSRKEDIAFTEKRFNEENGGGSKPTEVSKFSVSSSKLSFTKGGGQQTLTITTDAKSFTATSSADWLKVKADVEKGNVEVEATANTTTSERKATITLEHNGILRAGAPKKLTVEVTQSASENKPNPQPQGWDGGVSKIREAFKAGNTTAGKAMTVHAILINDPIKNNNSSKNILFSDGMAGIMIRLSDKGFYDGEDFHPGDEFELTIPADAKLARYENGTLQLELSKSNLKKVTKTHSVEPIEVTFADLMSNKIFDELESRLIKVSGVQFSKAGGEFARKNTSYHNIQESKSSKAPEGFMLPRLGAASKKFNKLNLATVPEGNGTIIGVAVSSKTNKGTGKGVCTIWIRSTEDLQLTGTRK